MDPALFNLRLLVRFSTKEYTRMKKLISLLLLLALLTGCSPKQDAQLPSQAPTDVPTEATAETPTEPETPETSEFP